MAGKKDGSAKKIAGERVDILFSHAVRADPVLAKRYVFLAREIAMRQRMRLPRRYRRKFCRVCGSYFVPGDNFRVRISNGNVIYTCLDCGAVRRFPLRQGAEAL
jgi:ribonuclease P protein subunit RPR2